MKTFLSVLLVTPLLFISSCSKDSNPSGPGLIAPPKIETGTETTVATQPISSSGGKIRVTSADTLINGLELTVPRNAYAGARTFTISYAPIQSHQFDEYFVPISPLISISNGGGYADSMMFLRIPITLPDGAYPVAFLYDDVNQTLEPAPMLSFDKQGVTIMSRHFDVGGISSGLGKYGRAFGNGITRNARYVISMLVKKVADAIAIAEPLIPTGYSPGIDDWEFPNYGSYIAPGGHCAGQNASSLWYFFEKKKKLNEPPLYHRFDSVNVSPSQLWQDNPLGYRMASGVQVKEDWDTYMRTIYLDYVGMQDDWTWYSLILSMHEYHKPLNLSLWGFDSDGNIIGHSVTAYEIDAINGRISIADPNYPGDKTRRVTYNGATFDYYYSGPNASKPGVPFRKIRFASTTSTINWSAIGDIWNSVVVGKQNPGFPAYHLRVENGGYELAENTVTNSDTLDISVNWAEPIKACFQVFDRGGTRVVPTGVPYAYTLRDPVVLKLGENILGFAIYAAIPPNPPATTDWSYQWVDFRWFHITKTASPPAITSIIPGAAKVGDTVKVTGRNFGADKTKGSVRFSNGVVATDIISWNDTTISVKVPQGAQTGSVTVTVNTLTSNAVPFTVSNVPAPVITSLTPNLAMANDTISIDGNNFGTDRTKGSVQFTSAVVQGAATVSWSNTRIRVAVPSLAGTGPLNVSVNGVSSNQIVFTLNSKAVITSVTPTQVSFAMAVRISGKNFGLSQGANSIKFATYVPKAVVSWRDNEIVATVPEDFKGGVITLTIGGVSCVSGTISNSPQITSVSPDSAFAEEIVTIRGKMFGYEQGRSRIMFGYVDTASVIAWTDTALTVIVPDPASHLYGSQRIKITLGNGLEKIFNNFFVIEDVLETLHRTNAVTDISFRAMMTMYLSPGGNQTKDNSLRFGTNYINAPLTWSGAAFHSSSRYTSATDTSTITFDGKVSDDGKTLLTITGTYLFSSSYDWSVGYAHSDVTEMRFKNIPLYATTPDQNSVIFRAIGAGGRDNVVSVKYESRRQGIVIKQYISTDWTNATQQPMISISFH